MRIELFVALFAGVVACGGTQAPSDSPDAQSPDVDASVDASIDDVGPPDMSTGCKSHITSISGTIYDPAGKYPVYQALVYVPSAPIDPIVHGATCDRCGQPVSGKPVVTTLTNAKGQFELKNPPAGANVPVVIQLGKWRRTIVIPKVDACADNPIVDEDLSRLPKNQVEGDMPRVALVQHLDNLQELLVDLGIDGTEFTSPSGNGAVHVYPTNLGVGLFESATELMKYDVVMDGCDGNTEPPPQPSARQNVAAYVNAGGRLYATHYEMRWFSDPLAPADLRAAATWTNWGNAVPPPYLVNATFPNGKALADWMKNVSPSSTYGVMPLPSPLHDVQSDIGAANFYSSWAWVSPKGTTASTYLSITTPTTVPPAKRCGRSVLADLHEAWFGNESLYNRTTLPGAFEFMFFAANACVQDDSIPRQEPPLD